MKKEKLLRAVERMTRVKIERDSKRGPICVGWFYQPKRPVNYGKKQVM